MKTLRISLMTFIAGIAAGFAAAYLLLHQPGTSTGEIITRQISGEKISHDSFDFSGSGIKFKTSSEGKGEALTEIPKTLIPEADAWMTRNHSLTVSYGYMLDRDGAAPFIGVMYGYRFNSITLGGGVDVSHDFVGVKASVGLLW